MRATKQELELHGLCEELPLDFLDAAAVGQYLAGRFPESRFPSELARGLHRHTDGNPLFLVNTVDDLIAQGQLREVDGQWTLTVPADDIALGAPQTLWQMVEKQVERLTPEERAMLAVASVAGAEFSAAVAAAAGIDAHEGERRCEALARRGQFLRATGVAEWPDGTVAGRYAFIHALYQSVLYAGVPIGQRVGLHLRIGERLERGYGPSRGRDRRRAGDALRAGPGLRAGAPVSTTGRRERAPPAWLPRGRHARDAGPGAAADVAGRRGARQQELRLQIMLGAALTATRGYAAPEVERTYARARELCAQVGDTSELWPALHGLTRFYFVQGALQTARDVIQQFLTMAETSHGCAPHDCAPLLSAYTAAGVVAFYRGEFAEALDHLERGIALYDPDEHSPDRLRAFRVDQDPGVSCLVHSALTLWVLGHPARAAARAERGAGAGALAPAPAQPRLRVSLRRRVPPVPPGPPGHAGAGRQRPRAGDGARPRLLPRGRGHPARLAARASEGHAEEGLAQMRQGIAASRQFGADLRIPTFLASMAEVYEKSRRPADGLSMVSEALAVAEPFGQHYYWTAELHRLKGALTLPSDEKTAEACFREAIGIARRQGAKSFELRAATSLSRLWASQGKASEAHALLSDVYTWFTEGFETADLTEARSLLTELGSRATGRPSPGACAR